MGNCRYVVEILNFASLNVKLYLLNHTRMKILFTSLSLLLFICNCFAQDVLLEQNIRLRSSLSDRRDVYPIVDNETGDMVLFLLDNDSINAQVYHKDYNFYKSYHCIRPKGKYKVLVGNTVTDNQYHLYFANKRKKEFLVKTIRY